jgi:hypothetical protein
VSSTLPFILSPKLIWANKKTKSLHLANFLLIYAPIGFELPAYAVFKLKNRTSDALAMLGTAGALIYRFKD